MPSPFPGIDPYLEAQSFWEGFHQRYVTYLCDDLNDLLPRDYVATLGEHLHLVELTPREAKQILPDVAILGEERKAVRSGARAKRAGGTLTFEPVTIPLPRVTREVHDVWIEIRRPPKRTPITVI